MAMMDEPDTPEDLLIIEHIDVGAPLSEELMRADLEHLKSLQVRAVAEQDLKAYHLIGKLTGLYLHRLPAAVPIYESLVDPE